MVALPCVAQASPCILCESIKHEETATCVWSDLPEPCSLRERLRTHKVFKKDQYFYLNYHKFSLKSYVLDVY